MSRPLDVSGHIFKLVRDVRVDAGKHLRLTSCNSIPYKKTKTHTEVWVFCYISYRECALKSAADCVEIQAGGMSNTV